MHEDKLPEIAGVFRAVMGKRALLIPEARKFSALSLEADLFLARSMTFTGKVRGGLLLAMPERTAGYLAAKFFGMEGEDPLKPLSALSSRDGGRDSLGEILDITCSFMLIALFGEGEPFGLSHPTPLSLAGREIALLARKQGSQVFVLDDSPVLLQATFCPPVRMQA
ncbi:MAG: hypothetical protein ABI036_17375 [Fibrobacteria bacterium]